MFLTLNINRPTTAQWRNSQEAKKAVVLDQSLAKCWEVAFLLLIWENASEVRNDLASALVSSPWTASLLKFLCF